MVEEPDQFSSLMWTGRVDAHSEHVYRHVMVVPTNRDQIVRVVIASIGPLDHVVRLKPVAIPTPAYGATALIAAQYVAAHRRGDRLSPI